jgi:hypothetical protein
MVENGAFSKNTPLAPPAKTLPSVNEVIVVMSLYMKETLLERLENTLVTGLYLYSPLLDLDKYIFPFTSTVVEVGAPTTDVRS